MQAFEEQIPKTKRIGLLVEALFEATPQIEVDRAVLLTESYKATEGQPMVTRRAKAFSHILHNIPITIRPNELVVGSTTQVSRSCQVFPEFSFEWLLAELDTVATRSADPFYISEANKQTLREVYTYWGGKTTSELARGYMSAEALSGIENNIFTPGNYYYNGVGHVTVLYDKILAIGYEGIIAEIKEELSKWSISDPSYIKRVHLLEAMIESCESVIAYAKRYAALAREMASTCKDSVRQRELLKIADNCERVPAKGATSFHEACQSFWFVQMLLQTESSGHSISPGRFDQYMYPYYKHDKEQGILTDDEAQELIDCIWVKLNDLSKVRDAGSAEGFAGYGLFQNLIVGGQDENGRDATNPLSYMCIEASGHILLPQPSLSIRVWNGTPHDLLLKAAQLTRTGIGLPAYYNDEVIIPSLLSRGLTLEDARTYNIIGCVEPQKAGKTDGWHDAAFFNMCRPLELVFKNGYENGKRVGPQTGELASFTTFESLFEAYEKQMVYGIESMVNAINAIDVAHRELCPLPYLSCMIDDCIKSGLTLQEGGAVYNFTGPQGFGIANVADALYAVRTLVYDQKKVSLEDYSLAMERNFGKGLPEARKTQLTKEIASQLVGQGDLSPAQVIETVKTIVERYEATCLTSEYDTLLTWIEDVPKFGNDIDSVDEFARAVAYTYTRPLEKYKNPRGGIYQAGLYPVSANVPLGAQTGATPDGRLACTPVADGVSPAAGRDVTGPTAAANSVSKLDHGIASNGTLFNQKFHPSALNGAKGLNSFVHYIRGFFEQKGSHIQFNVVSRETLVEAQKNPEAYKSLVVRVAGYSALFTSLSRSLQEDIINRTEQHGL